MLPQFLIFSSESRMIGLLTGLFTTFPLAHQLVESDIRNHTLLESSVSIS